MSGRDSKLGPTENEKGLVTALSPCLIFFNFCGGTLGTAASTGLLYQPRMICDGDCGEIGGMKIGRVNRSTRRKPAPAPLCAMSDILPAIL
jgi:hypothetical protein